MRRGILLGLAMSLSTPNAAEAGFGGCNATAITIPIQGSAVPYPSDITLSAMPTLVTTVSVTMEHYSHAYSDDVGIVLVSPGGQALMLQDGVTEQSINDVTYNISDSGSTQLPDVAPISAGTFRPADYYGGDSFPAPGPLLAYGEPGPAIAGTATLASTFGGGNGNGTWHLYVRDFTAGSGGTFAGGWCINVEGTFDRVFLSGFE